MDKGRLESGFEWIQDLYDLEHFYKFLQEYLLDPKDLHHAEMSVFCVGILV
jgi:hypothetical protein